MRNNYNKLLDLVIERIKDKEAITKSDILSVIKDFQNLLKNETFRNLYQITEEDLSEKDTGNLTKDIETKFNIKMDTCVVLKGTEQKLKNNEWWTNKKNSVGDDEGFSYWDKYQKNLSFPPKVIRTIDVDTDCIMNNLFDPKTATNDDCRYGMVIGHVQSGKTSNYAGLICKAIDAGYKFFIVIAGIHNNLRNQTQERIKSIFSNISKNREPIFLTNENSDFKNNDFQRFSSLNFENTKAPFFLIIKKNTTVLDSVIKWVEKENNTVPLLLIDDEADNATINTKDENNPTAINKRIRILLKKFNKYSYIGYTATPFANIFINNEACSEIEGQDLFPKDFIVSLNAPSNYQGAQKLFLDNESSSNIISIDSIEKITDIKEFYAIKGQEDSCVFSIPRNHKKDFEPHNLPESLLLAIRMFYINIAIRNLRKQDDKHNSMLIHASSYTGVHSSNELYELVDEMNREKKTPEDFGLRVKAHPDSFLITARNKMKEATPYPAKVGLDGYTKETSRISNKPEIISKNISLISNFLCNSLSKYECLKRESVNKFLWLNVETKDIKTFVNQFHFEPNYEHLPIECIKQYLENYSQDLWRVALIGVEKTSNKIDIAGLEVGLQIRQVSNDGECYVLGVNRQMTSGLVEKWALLDEEFRNLKNEQNGESIKRRDIRQKMKHPTLMIHLITTNDDKNPKKVLPALSFTFPSIIGEREPKTITYMVNSVYLKQLSKMEELRRLEEEETDDD